MRAPADLYLQTQFYYFFSINRHKMTTLTPVRKLLSLGFTSSVYLHFAFQAVPAIHQGVHRSVSGKRCFYNSTFSSLSRYKESNADDQVYRPITLSNIALMIIDMTLGHSCKVS